MLEIVAFIDHQEVHLRNCRINGAAIGITELFRGLRRQDARRQPSDALQEAPA